jgi:hypothetical protein
MWFHSVVSFPTFFQETDDTASVAGTVPTDLHPTVPGTAFPGLFNPLPLQSFLNFFYFHSWK